MLFTLYYMYATLLQWWRLGALRNKLNGTLNPQNSLLIGTGSVIYDTRKQRSIENLLFHNEDRIGCTVVPKQKINLSQWIAFPTDYRRFPIYFQPSRQKIDSPNIYVLFETFLDTYIKHQSDIIEVEKFGDLLAWRVTDNFEAILKTDIDKLTKLIHCFKHSNIDINHELKLLRVETVDIEGIASKIKYDKNYPSDFTLKYSYDKKCWQGFVAEIKGLYGKIRDVNTPKITIENGMKADEAKKVPVSEVKPTKKETKPKDDKDTLEVNARRHKFSEHAKRERHTAVKEESKAKASKASKAPDTSTKLDKSSSKVNGSTSAKHRDKSLEKQSHKHQSKKPSKVAAKLNGAALNGSAHKVQSVKPPNILVYADSLIAKENVKTVLQAMINREKYAIYDLPTTPTVSAWNESTVLVVVCGTVPPNLTSNLLQYLISGGQLLCLCSDLLYSVLHTFATAEVREHELVRFSYGKWNQVQMMHHIFCYQASPAKKQFSKDSDHSNQSSGNGSSPIAPPTPSTVDFQHNGKDYTIQVRVLGTEETWQTPSLLLASVKGSKGRAVFSQVHLEINPVQYEDDEKKFEALKESDKARLEILQDILSNRLDIDCSTFTNLDYSIGYFLGRHDLKLKMLSECESIVNNRLICDKITLTFCGKDAKPDEANAQFLPVLIHSCPANFSTVNYFETLETDYIGRLVLYSDVISSSQFVINKTLAHGIVVIARQQTNGVGRSNNVWISPSGCALFSLQLHIPLDTPLGKVLPLVQQVVMVAVISAIRKINGCENLSLGLKWPNDLYANGDAKLGGIIANSTINSSISVINIGCGVNLDNSNPTTCINDLIGELNQRMGSDVKPILFENYFALVFNEIERLLDVIQGGDLDHFFELYYKYWLHSESNISITTPEGELRKVKITGIDQFGYLKVLAEDGTESTVEPDGNAFDMMKGLIAPKIF